MAGLYIHIPFCHAKCAYCDFYSRRFDNSYESEFLDALHLEWELRKSEVEDIKTIYFGGGTPSILSVSGIERLVKSLPERVGVTEFTVEFNPEDVCEQKLQMWKHIGANRISMGVQSFQDDELRFVGRRHTGQQAVIAYDRLRNVFDNVSLDLIIGLPGQTINSLTRNLEVMLSLKPDHISVYILSYERGTRLWAMRQAGKVDESDDETIARMYSLVCEQLAKGGYCHYEISNFALPGREAIHNSNYWLGLPYLGLGPGAHSFDGDVRRYNPSDLAAWHRAIIEGNIAYSVEKETEVDKVNNYIMTGLRTARGIDLSVIKPRYRQQVEDNLNEIPPQRYRIEGSRLTIPEDAWLLSDDTISRLFVE